LQDSLLPPSLGQSWGLRRAGLGFISRLSRPCCPRHLPGLGWGSGTPSPGDSGRAPSAEHACASLCTHVRACAHAEVLLRQQRRGPSPREPPTVPGRDEQGWPWPGSAPQPDPPAGPWDGTALRPGWETNPQVKSGPVAAGQVHGDTPGPKPSQEASQGLDPQGLQGMGLSLLRHSSSGGSGPRAELKWAPGPGGGGPGRAGQGH